MRTAIRIAFGRAIREHRLRRHFTQEELGFRSGLHPTYVGGIERGERNLGLENIHKLATALDTPAWQIMRRADELGDS